MIPKYNVSTYHGIGFQEYYFDIKEMSEDRFIMLLYHLWQRLYIFEDCQPEVWDSFRVIRDFPKW